VVSLQKEKSIVRYSKEPVSARVRSELYRERSMDGQASASGTAIQRGDANGTAPRPVSGPVATVRSRRWSLALVVLGTIVAAGPALARAEGVPPAPSGLELGLSVGYGQGFGPVGAGQPTLQGFGNAGGALELDVGWRIDPRWLVGAYGEVDLFDGGNLPGSDHATSVAAGLQGQFHLLPDQRLDPWIGLGFGWRGYWADFGNGTYGLQGLDLVRVRAGVDYRLSPNFSMGPVVGATLTDFLWSSPVGAGGYSRFYDNKLNTFVFAGIGGRFNL
jgi:hypothetical protein